MKNIRIYLVALCALALSAGTFLLNGAPHSIASPADKDVVVTNTPSNPVPVQAQGTMNVSGNVSISNTPGVSIANTPTVYAQQSGPWNVNISNPPAVTIDSSAPVNVHDVDNPALQPFQKAFFVEIPPGSEVADDRITVPAGKRLEIEFATNSIDAPTGKKLWLRLDAIYGGAHAHYNLTSTLIGDITADRYVSVGNEVTRIYADPGSVVTLQALVLDGPADRTSRVFVTMSGHLVNLP